MTQITCSCAIYLPPPHTRLCRTKVGRLVRLFPTQKRQCLRNTIIPPQETLFRVNLLATQTGNTTNTYSHLSNQIGYLMNNTSRWPICSHCNRILSWLPDIKMYHCFRCKEFIKNDADPVTAELADAKKLISDLICENQGLKHKIDMINAAGSTYKGPDPGGIIDGMIKQQQLKATGSVIWGTDPGGRIDYLTKHQTKETGE